MKPNLIKITTPYPGKIYRIPFSTGSPVKKKDVVIVLESMKMENEICAPSGGTIQTIFVKEGDFVKTGDPLLSLTLTGKD